MKIFIDSAKLDEIEEAYSSGVLDGVTTNPSLLKKAVQALKDQGRKVDMEEYIKSILKTARGTPVSLEVTACRKSRMIKQGKTLFKKFNPIAKNVIIKIPINPSFPGNENRDRAGLQAIKELSLAGIPVNATLIMTPEQALLAAKAGAKIVSPFAGRIDDHIRKSNRIDFEKTDYYPAEGLSKASKCLEDEGIVSGIDLVEECVQLIKGYGFETEVLAASIRNVRQTREAALVGADIATLPLAVIEDLLKHPQTREGMKKFTQDIIPEYEEIAR